MQKHVFANRVADLLEIVCLVVVVLVFAPAVFILAGTASVVSVATQSLGLRCPVWATEVLDMMS